MNWLRDLWVYVCVPDRLLRQVIRKNQREDQLFRREVKRDNGGAPAGFG